MTTKAMRIYRPLLATSLFLAVVTAVAGYAHAQPAPKPFTKDDVVRLLSGNVPVKRVETLVRERGIDFQITQETESELRKAGATDSLLAALRDLVPKPPTLVVTTVPGGARVYIDDEFLDTTSSEGRLKLTTVASGRHKLRVALGGYRDYGVRIDLEVGKTVEVSANQELAAQPGAGIGKSKPLDASNGIETAAPSSSGSSMPSKTLRLPGSCCGGFVNLNRGALYKYTVPGTIIVTNGKLEFSSSFVGASWRGVQSFDVPLSDVVALNQNKNSVECEMHLQGKKVRRTFWVQLVPGKGNAAEAANIEAAKELFEALKGGSK